jgi:hypothetical protein
LDKFNPGAVEGFSGNRSNCGDQDVDFPCYPDYLCPAQLEYVVIRQNVLKDL